MHEKQYKNVKIINECFTDEYAKSFSDLNALFISDIRTVIIKRFFIFKTKKS